MSRWLGKVGRSLQEWREHILALLLRNLVPLAAVVALPSIALALSNEMVSIALFDTVAIAALCVLWRHKALSFQARAWGLCGLLYLTGSAFLLLLGTYSQIYLMSCAAMAAILLGRKSALLVLLVCTLTVLGVGYGVKQDVSLPGLEQQPLLNWTIIAINFAFVNGIISISVGALLRGLEHSLNDAHNSEERYRTAFTGSPDAMSIRRLSDGICLDVNEGFVRQHGHRRHNVVGKPFKELKVWRDDGQRQQMEVILQRDGVVENFEAEFVASDGKIIPGLLSAHLLTLSGERCVLAVMRDISERKRIEAELLQHRLHLEDLVNQRTSELEQSNRDLALQHEFIRMVTDSVPSLIGYWNADLRCSFANRAYQEFFDVPANKVVGMHARDVLGDALFKSSQRHLEMAMQGKYQRFRTTVARPDGKTRHLEVQYIPHWMGARVVGCYVVSDNMTELKLAEQQLRGLNYELAVQVESAQVANRAKSDFLANMSHEIRTPMNGVLGMVDVMQQSQLSTEQRRMLDTIQKSSVSLLNILNDILDYSKIEAGKLQVEQVPTQLQEVAEGAVSLMEHAAKAKRVALTVSVSPDLPTWTLSDPLRLQQVLLNLLGNAVKFTTDYALRRGRVDLVLKPCTRPDGSAGVQLRVADTGIGIAKDILDQLFQPFQQADASTARRFGGTGLGLSITHQLVALMGGSISAHSTLGQGSEFVATLPLLPCEPGEGAVSRIKNLPAQRVAPTIEQALQRGQLILLAEDNETNQDVILQQLRLLGYVAEVAPDGVAAFDMWSRGHYALLLTDCHMPRMDGYALTEAIRQEEALHGGHMPIVAVTANAMQGEGQRCLDRGMDAYLAKPLRLEELNAVLSQWLPLPLADEAVCRDDLEMPRPADSVPAPAAGLPVWDPQSLIALVGNNPPAHQRLLRMFLEGANLYVPQIVTASERSDVTTLASVAHKLKSSARSVGALALGERCQALETSGQGGDAAQCRALAELLQQDLERVTAVIAVWV